MKIYFILIIYLYAATGKHLTTKKEEVATSTLQDASSTQNPTDEKLLIKRNVAGPITSLQIVQNNSSLKTTNLINTSEITTQNSSKLIFEEKIHKPRIIVTFLSTSKLERNRSEPVYVDPFQRILQFFLSTFIRDLTEPKFPFERNEHYGCGHRHSCLKCRRDSNTVVDLLPENTKNESELTGNSTQTELAENVTCVELNSTAQNDERNINKRQNVEMPGEDANSQLIAVKRASDMNSETTHIHTDGTQMLSIPHLQNPDGSHLERSTVLINEDNEHLIKHLTTAAESLKTVNVSFLQKSDAIKNNSDFAENVKVELSADDVDKLRRIRDVEYVPPGNLKTTLSVAPNTIENENKRNLYVQDHNFIRDPRTITKSNKISTDGNKRNTPADTENNENLGNGINEKLALQNDNPNMQDDKFHALNSKYLILQNKNTKILQNNQNKELSLESEHQSEGNLKNKQKRFITINANPQNEPELRSINGNFETAGQTKSMVDEARLEQNNRFTVKRNPQIIQIVKPENEINREEPSLIYAVVTKGVDSFHKNRRNATTYNLQNIKKENRVTPLIEIVKMYPENKNTNGSEQIMNYDPKYSYSTSGDSITKGTTVSNDSKLIIANQVKENSNEPKYVYSTSGDSITEGTIDSKLIIANQVKENSTKDAKVEPKHVNHYFLSISGDAGKSVAALNNSDADESFAATDEVDYQAPNGPDFFLVDDENDVFEIMLQDNVTPKVENGTGLDKLLPPPDDPKKPARLKYSKMYYVFTVTIPIVAAFALSMGGLCFCLRSSGACCRLFLTDPSIEIEVKK